MSLRIAEVDLILVRVLWHAPTCCSTQVQLRRHKNTWPSHTVGVCGTVNFTSPAAGSAWSQLQSSMCQITIAIKYVSGRNCMADSMVGNAQFVSERATSICLQVCTAQRGAAVRRREHTCTCHLRCKTPCTVASAHSAVDSRMKTVAV